MNDTFSISKRTGNLLDLVASEVGTKNRSETLGHLIKLACVAIEAADAQGVVVIGTPDGKLSRIDITK